MLVGYTFSEKLLEIGMRYKTDEDVFVFHAQKYKKLYEEDWQNG